MSCRLHPSSHFIPPSFAGGNFHKRLNNEKNALQESLLRPTVHNFMNKFAVKPLAKAVRDVGVKLDRALAASVRAGAADATRMLRALAPGTRSVLLDKSHYSFCLIKHQTLVLGSSHVESTTGPEPTAV